MKEDSRTLAVLALAHEEVELRRAVKLAKQNADYKNSTEFKAALNKHRQCLNGISMDLEEMRIIIKEKKINCAIFEYTDSGNLKAFLSKLINNPEVYNQGFLVLTSSARMGGAQHWSASDIQIRKEGIEILLFDSLTSEEHARAVKHTGASANRLNLEVALSQVESSKPIKIIECYAIQAVQASEFGCGSFALNAAITMRKIPDLHDAARNCCEAVDQNNNIERYIVNLMDLPARLIKNIMSNELIKKYEEIHKHDEFNKIGSRNLTLGEYTAKRTFYIPGVDNPEILKKRNLGIFFTRENYRNIIKNHTEVAQQPVINSQAVAQEIEQPKQSDNFLLCFKSYFSQTSGKRRSNPDHIVTHNSEMFTTPSLRTK